MSASVLVSRDTGIGVGVGFAGAGHNTDIEVINYTTFLQIRLSFLSHINDHRHSSL